jgi:endo-1,4-beta-xylanase
MLKTMKVIYSVRLFTVLFVFGFLAFSVHAQTTILLQNDFEKSTENWENRGSASIKSVKDEAANGEKSMRVSGRTEFWQGCQLNLTKLLKSGATYQFTVSVKLNKKEQPDAIKMTMQRGDTVFDGVGGIDANANEWKTFSGKFRPTGGDPYLLLYIEAGRARTSFFVDDFKIETIPDAPAQTGTLLKNDFEDMTGQNWFVRGEGVEMFSSTAAGSRGIRVDGRTEPWHGLAVDVSPIFFKGRTYLISISVKLAKGQPDDSLKLTMQQTPPKGDKSYVQIAEAKTVTDGEWVTLSGQYTATTTDNNLLIYVEAVGKTTSFFIDNFEIKMP